MSTFEDRCLSDPQGVIKDLVAQTSRQAEAIHKLNKTLERLSLLEAELRSWASLTGQDLCWHHPEILQKLCKISDIKCEKGKCLPSKESFALGCQTYMEGLYK